MGNKDIILEWLNVCEINPESTYNIIHKFDSDLGVDWGKICEIGDAFNLPRVWDKWHMNWLEYVTHCVFPYKLYEAADYNIITMMKDERLKPDNMKLGSTHSTVSYFGRLCNWYDYRINNIQTDLFHDKIQPFNQIQYMINRLTYVPTYAKKPIRGTNTFAFYTTSPAWLYETLAKYPEAPKAGRTNWACLFMVSFNYYNDKLNATAIFRNLYASHIFGDMLGIKMMLDAICKECNIKPGTITIHGIHWEFEMKKIIKPLIKKELSDENSIQQQK